MVELENDADKEFILDGLTHGFRIIDNNSVLDRVEMNNYDSATCLQTRHSVEDQIQQEIQEGNYVITKEKPTVVSALGAIPKADSTDIRLIHDCSRPQGIAVNDYASIDKQTFQSVHEATRLIHPGYYMAKVDLKSAYRSVPIHPDCYAATGLKWKFSGNKSVTYLYDTRLPFGSRAAPGIFHRITQAVRRMMSRKGISGLVVYLDDFLIIARTQSECKR